MKRINLSFSERQFKAIQKNAEALDIRAGTYCKLAALSAAGVQYIPDTFTMPSKIKQLNLFEGAKK